MAGNPLTNPDWAPELADTVDRLVGRVRDNATSKAVKAVRGVVFGLVVGVTAITALVLAIIIGTRLLQQLLTIAGLFDADTSVWVSYMIMAGILFVAGVFCMRKRSAPDAAGTSSTSSGSKKHSK